MTEFILYLGVGALVLAFIDTAAHLCGVDKTFTGLIEHFVVALAWPLLLVGWIVHIKHPYQPETYTVKCDRTV